MEKKLKNRVILALVVMAAVSFSALLPFAVKEHKLNAAQARAAATLDENADNYNEGTIVLSDTTREEAEKLSEKLGAKLRITSDGSYAALRLPDGVTIDDVVRSGDYREYVDKFSPDFYTRISDITDEEESVADEGRKPTKPEYSVSDTLYKNQTYIDYVNIGAAWNTYKGSGVTVAVIDTGIDTDHIEFAGRISEYSYNATTDKIVKDYAKEDGTYDWSIIEDEQGHGTSVAGVIAAGMNGEGTVGIAPEVTLLVIKAESDENGAFRSTADLVFGLNYAVERDADIVNMSFGAYTPTNPFARATRLAIDSDVICVAAAGNDATSALCYPAADENVIAVGALKENGNELAEYSNFGENSDVVAPGTTFTTKRGGGYGVSTGTSLASPIVAGAMALLKNGNQYMEFEQARELLYASCYDLGAKGDDWYFGYGAIDVSALTVEQRGTVTFDMLTDEIEDIEQKFILNHALQNIPEPTRTYSIFDGWYYDIDLKEELNLYEDVWTGDITLYAKWANEDDGVPYTYVTLDDGTVEIRSYTGKRRYITVPDKIYEKTVSSIGDFAFDGQTRLRQVNLPKTITNIGKFAFRNCNNLYALNLPDGVKTIDENAFENTVRLQNIGMNAGIALEKVGDFAFKGSGLTRFDVTAKVSYLNGSAFFGANSLKTFTVAKSNVNYTVFDGVLFNKTASKIVAYPAAKSGAYTIKDGVTSIGDYAFGYAKIKNIDLNKTERIGEWAFAFSSLESLIIPDNVVALSAASFAYNFNLKAVTLGGGLTEIPKSAFYMGNITGLSVPKNIAVIGPNAFAANQIETLVFEENSGLLEIGEAAFSLIPVQKVKFPASLVVIGASAFAKDGYLTEITFEENSNLQYIGSYAFEKTSFTSVTFPSGLVGIGDYAFISSALTGEVALPASLKNLGAGAFASCGQLTQISVEEGNKAYASVAGVVYTLDKTTLVAYPAGNAASEYSLLESTLVVADSAFYGSENLTQITLDEALTNIERYAFYSVAKLGGISIPDNVVQISNYAFARDYNLGYIAFTENSKLPRISYAAFADSGVYSMRIPASVSTMAQEAFAGCNNLHSVTFAAGSKLDFIPAYAFSGANNLTQVTFETGSALTAVSAHGFEGAKRLTTVNFGDAVVTRIDNYAFRYCENLTTISFNEGLKEIGRFAFYGCKSLTRLDIPESLERIGRYAFYGAENLNIFFAAESLPQYLQESWDDGIAGYYVGIKEVLTSGEWNYATLKSGGVSIVKYTGTETELDLTFLDLGGDIKQIGGYAFHNSNITSIILPSTLESIQRYAFAYSALENIQIPAHTSFIGQYAFFNTPLKTVIFEENSALKKIEKYAFSFNKSLESFALPASVSEIGSYLLYNSGVKTLTFAADSALTTISAHAFASTAIESVVLPDSVNYVDDNAFRDSVYLKSVTFGAAENLQVHSNAFYNTGLTSLYLPANLSYVGEYAFIGLKDLTAYTVADENPRYKSINGVLYSKDGKKLIAYPAGKTGNFTVPKEVETIGFGAFENSLIEAVSFEDGINLLTIGYRAFYKSEKLASVSIPESVVSIDFYAFAECRNLERVTFAENNKLMGIYEGAFLNCSSLTDIIIPDNIVEVSDFAFYGCRALTKLPFSETSEVKGIYDYAFAYSGITELVIPDSVVEIGAYAFRGARLATVKISDAQMYQLIIGIGAFQGCEELSEITLPFIGASFEDEDITWFGYIFGAGAYTANNTYVPASLKTVTITEGISFVGTGAFYHLLNLEKINVPHSVRKVYMYSFVTTAEYEFTNEISTDSDYLGTEYFTVNGDLIFESTNVGNVYVSGISGDLVLAEGLKTIDRWAFNMGKLTSVYIPSSVQAIGDYAFQSCEKLEKVVFGENCKITEISERLFNGDVSLSEIELPETVEKIGGRAFSSCESLKNIIIPSSVKNIESGTFFRCKSLTSVSFGENSQLQSLGEYAFAYCSGLADIKIPEGITTIEDGTFANCGFVSFEIPGSVTDIKSYAFSECKSLESIYIPNNVEIIDIGVFTQCTALTMVEIGKNVKDIKNGAFIDCLKLYKIMNNSELAFTIGSEDNGYIAYYAEEIIDKDGNKTYKDEGSGFAFVDTIDGFRFTVKNGEYTLIAYLGNEDTVRLPDDINGKEYSIYQMTGVKNVIIPGVMDNIGHHAFAVALDSLVIEEGIRYIGDQALHNGVLSISLPASLQSVGYENFVEKIETIKLDEKSNYFVLKEGVLYSKDYSRLIRCPANVSNFVIPNEITYIESYAFYGCDSLLDVYYDGTIEEWFEVGLGWLSSNPGQYAEHFYINGNELAGTVVVSGKTSISNSQFANNKKITEVIISEGTEYIGSFAFENCTNIRKITLPASLKFVEQYAFSGCDNLTEIVFNGKLENWFNIHFTLFNYLLNNAKNLYIGGENIANATLIIPKTVTEINENVFSGFKGLTSIVISSNVLSVGKFAFSDCVNLSKVVFEEESQLTSIGDAAFNSSGVINIELPSSVTYIGDGAFNYCYDLTNIILPDTLLDLGANMFVRCKNLQYVQLPSVIESIPDSMFLDCGSLTFIELPKTVVTIKNSAFRYCTNLAKIELPSVLTNIGEYAFESCRNLYEIINNSDLPLKIGNQDYGQIAYNAKAIIDKNGNRTYKDGVSNFEYIDTIDGFCFKMENGQYALISYLGNEDTVTLPKDINGESYNIFQLKGVKNVVIPQNIQGIEDKAFAYCNSLISVTIEKESKLTYIGDMAFLCCERLRSVDFGNSELLTDIKNYAFYKCQNLSNIILPSNVTSIGYGAFLDTIYYNDLSNWNNGCLYINNYLIKVSAELNFVKVRDDTTCFANDAFGECNKLLQLEMKGDHSYSLSTLTNLKSLVLNETPAGHAIWNYFGGDPSSIPITFKIVVLRKGCKGRNYLFAGISGITIYVEDEKQACQWDNDYPGWNNGNRVYYGGEWINAEFKNADGEIISSDYYTVNQVVRQPFVDSIENGTKKLVFVGWDLDGDGIADNMPATSTKNISATAVMAEADNVVTVRYYDFDGLLYVKQNYIYGDTIVQPAALSKKGYVFDGWQGYTENMLVTSDLEFVSLWTHEGGGHTFDTVTIEPTCTEKGYDRHTCSVCDYEYTDNFVDESGHSFGSWKIGTEPTCTEEGLEYRECSNCSIREEAPIAAKGHNYTVKVITEPTCAHTGKKTYTCADCGTVETEILAQTEHKYKKHYVSKSWLEMLVERILNVFFGYEGENAFFYRCEVCGEIMTSSGISAMSVSAQDTCVHELGEWEVSVEPTHIEGIAIRKCSICGKAVEAKTLEADGTHTESNWIIDIEPTCAAKGLRHKECTFCGEVLEYEVLSELGHDYEEEWTVDREATCTEKGSKSHHCTRCSAVNEVTEIAATGHTEVVDSGKAATCTETGLIEGKHCSVCGKVLVKQEVVAKKAHTESDWIIDVEPTCEGNGSKHKVCEVCNEILAVEAIAATGHTEVIDEAKVATCAETGLTEGKHCSVCGKVLKAQEVVAKKAHTESDWIIDVEATCEVSGSKHKVCKVCNEILKVEAIAALGHDYASSWTTDKAATCTEDGSMSRHCSRCSAVTDVIASPAPGHTPSEWLTDSEASCVAAGAKHRVCTVCGKLLNTETIAAKGHEYGETIVIEATCEKDGYTYHVCGICGYTKKVSNLLAKGHTEVIDEAKEATCTETGLTDGKHCGVCGKILKAQEVAAKTAHAEGEWIVDSEASCVKNGSRHKECTACGKLLETQMIYATGHRYGDTITVEATCETDGYTYHVCETCGFTEKLSDLSRTGHGEGEWVVDLMPTCETKGQRHVSCTNCGKVLTIEAISELGHQYSDEWTIDREATCTATGIKSRHCERCSATTDVTVLDIINHAYGDEIIVEATCEKAGYTYHVCATCGYSEKVRDIEAKGHTESGWITDSEAGCITEGVQHKECTVCGKILDTQIINVTGHNYGETLTVEATCEKAGYTYHVCATCGYSEKVEDIEAKGHAESDWLIDVAATCGQDGYKHKECLTCGKTLEKEYLDREVHSYGDTLTVAATCEKAGYTYHVCEVCGRYEKIDDLGATGHTESDWIVDREATCTAEGLEHKECTVCGKILDTKTTEADAHTYGETLTVEATCEKAGYTYHICKVCGHYEKIVDLPAQGHSHIIDWGKDATCTETGLTKGEHCGTCGKVFVEQEVIAKIAHTESEWIVDNAATCAGSGFRHKECLTCGEILKIEQINPNGHKYGDTLTVEATCEKEGYTYHVCETCGYSERTSTLNATGHTEVIDRAKAATCSETGLTAGKHCSVCGKVLKAQEVIAKKAHTESEWIVDSKAGCETAGSKHKECAVCKEILKIESIAAEGHTAGDYIVDYDATCESAGSKHKECEKCGKVLERAQIAAKGHEFGEWTVDLEPTVNAEGREYRKCLRCEHREERSVEKLKGGCGGSVYADGGLFAIILALAVSVVTTMRKRGKQR